MGSVCPPYNNHLYMNYPILPVHKNVIIELANK